LVQLRDLVITPPDVAAHGVAEERATIDRIARVVLPLLRISNLFRHRTELLERTVLRGLTHPREVPDSVRERGENLIGEFCVALLRAWREVLRDVQLA